MDTNAISSINALDLMLKVSTNVFTKALDAQETAFSALIDDMASLSAGISEHIGLNIDYEA